MKTITISHGLLNHTMRRLPIAMLILGYINHSAPAHLPSDSEIDAKFNAPADLPKATPCIQGPLQCPKEVSWSTLILNETHMQIQFILEESVFLKITESRLLMESKLRRKVPPGCIPPVCTLIIDDTEGHDLSLRSLHCPIFTDTTALPYL